MADLAETYSDLRHEEKKKKSEHYQKFRINAKRDR
jgi:hypothetical protein